MPIQIEDNGGDPAVAAALRDAIEPIVDDLRDEIRALRDDVRQLRGERSSAAMISMSEAAAIAGISERTFQTLVHEGVVPSAKIGRRRLIPKEAFRAWLRRQIEEGG
jgi:excisionase family DNA binding protein